MLKGKPLAGAMAVLTLLLADALLLGDRTPWAWLAERIPRASSAAAGVARDRDALSELARAAQDRVRVAVLGSSRAVVGFRSDLAERKMPESLFVKLAHAGVTPFVIRGLVEELRGVGVDAVVLVLSELDTHRPVRLEPIPGPGSAAVGLAALPDLLAATGAGFALRNRESLFRLTAAAALRGYRYRGVLQAAGLGAPLAFTTDARVAGPRQDLGLARSALGEPRPHRITPNGAERVRAVLEKIPRALRPAAMVEVDIVSEIGSGPQVAVQLALLRRSVARLREVGAAVVLVEGPLNPVTAELYDVGLRQEFLAFAGQQAKLEGVWFVALEQLPPFDEADFSDLLHTTPRGAAKLTGGIVTFLQRMGVHRAS